MKPYPKAASQTENENFLTKLMVEESDPASSVHNYECTIGIKVGIEFFSVRFCKLRPYSQEKLLDQIFFSKVKLQFEWLRGCLS